MQLLSPTNRLFVLAQEGQRLTHVVLACLLAFLFAFIAPLPVAILVYTLLPTLPATSSAIGSALELIANLVLQFVPIALAVWAWIALYERRAFWTLGLEWHDAARKYVRGLLIGLALFGLAVAIAAALGDLAYEPGDPRAQGFGALGGVLLVYIGWTVQGPIEEILCRGWLLQTIGARYRPAVGVAVSTLVFACLHSLNPNLSVLAVINLCLFGLFAALYTLWEGGLWGVCALHAAWNWAQGNLFGLEVSGQSVAGGILFNLRETGPDLITGGPFGPEAGLAVTAVLVIGIIILLRRSMTAPGKVDAVTSKAAAISSPEQLR